MRFSVTVFLSRNNSAPASGTWVLGVGAIFLFPIFCSCFFVYKDYYYYHVIGLIIAIEKESASSIIKSLYDAYNHSSKKEFNPKEARARFTDYSRRLAEENYSTKIREPYGFWWLSTPNNNGGWGEDGNVYVYHVCNNGTINGFERASYKDGVRPTMWIKID